MMLEYDGGTHEYKGEIYALVVNNQLINPPLSPFMYATLSLILITTSYSSLETSMV